MNKCKTCKCDIDDYGSTGHKLIFCGRTCKQYFTNHIVGLDIDGALKHGLECGDDEDKLREWAKVYLSGGGKLSPARLTDKFKIASGLSVVIDKIQGLISGHPSNEHLSKPNEKYFSWLENSIREVCPVCSTGWPSFNQTTWRKYCSEKCCNISKRSGGNTRDKIDQSMVEKYGVRGGFTKERVIEFGEQRFKRTGFRNPMQDPIHKEKLLKYLSSVESKTSKPEYEIGEYFEKVYGLKVVKGAYNIIPGKQLDLFFPEKRVAVEYNGCYYHSEGNGGRAFAKWRHVEKTSLCEERGIQLIHVWEDEWTDSQDVVLGMLESKLGLVPPVTYARKTTVVKGVDPSALYNLVHIQGQAKASIVYGLEYRGQLVASMSFTRTGVDKEFEINRFASQGVVGAFGKLLKAFQSENQWERIISFGDRCVVYRNDNIYLRNGFTEESVSPPDYKYTSGKRDRIHKFNFRKQRLSSVYGFPMSMTEDEMVAELGFKRIYNSGLIRYQLTNHQSLTDPSCKVQD